MTETTDTLPPPCPAPRSEAAQRIVQVAERLFAERGYEGVSIRDIAEAAEVSKANVFHHFENKWDLYKAVVETCAGEFRQLLTRLQLDSGTPEQILGGFSEAHLMRMLDQSCASALFLRQMLDSREGEEKKLAERTIEDSFVMIVEALTGLKRAGKLADRVDPRVLAMTLVGSHVAFFLMRDVLPRNQQGKALADPRAYNRAVVDLLTDGIFPAKNSTP